MGPYISHHWHHPFWICQSWALKYKYNTWWYCKWDRLPLSMKPLGCLLSLSASRVESWGSITWRPRIGVYEEIQQSITLCPGKNLLFGWFLIRTLRILVDYAFTVLLTLHSRGIVDGRNLAKTHLGCIKPCFLMGWTTNLNWCRISAINGISHIGISHCQVQQLNGAFRSSGQWVAMNFHQLNLKSTKQSSLTKQRYKRHSLCPFLGWWLWPFFQRFFRDFQLGHPKKVNFWITTCTSCFPAFFPNIRACYPGWSWLPLPASGIDQGWRTHGGTF